MNRIKLFIDYLKNNRIQEYDNIIKNALNNNYEVISLRNYVEEKFNKTKKLLVLRHDVDHFSDGTKLMFEVERKYNVTSSFYFRNSTYESKLMKDIEEYGNEASLHFEPIADFVKANNIKNQKELHNSENWEQKCLDILKANLIRYRNLLGIPCSTIASHGEYENSLVQTPNNYLTEDVKRYEYLDIKIEAYNKNMIKKVTCYISDVPIEENGGYRYGLTPIEAINRDEQFIMFLSHPNHWHYSLWKQFKKLVKIIIRKPVVSKQTFKRI
jgi:hypothetical protein